MTVPPGTTVSLGVDPALIGVDEPGAADRLLQRGPHGGIEVGQSLPQRLGRHPDVVQLHAVEPPRGLDQRGDPMVPHGLDDRADPLDGGVHVQFGARQHLAGVRRGTPEIDSGQHTLSLGNPVRTVRPGSHGLVTVWRGPHAGLLRGRGG